MHPTQEETARIRARRLELEKLGKRQLVAMYRQTIGRLSNDPTLLDPMAPKWSKAELADAIANVEEFLREPKLFGHRVIQEAGATS